MIKDNQTFFNRLHLWLDGLGIILSYMAAWCSWFSSQYTSFTGGAKIYNIKIDEAL